MIGILILVGKTASGKTTIKDKLIKKGFVGITTYTSRPMRKGEKQDITYHYISKEEFLQKVEDNFFVEWDSYNTKEGTWYYGTALEDLENAEDNSVIILTPRGFKAVKDKLGDRVSSLYIYANNFTIKKRLKSRGDNKEEAERRFEKDTVDFKGVENEVDKIVYNNDGYDIDDVVQKILNIVEVG